MNHGDTRRTVTKKQQTVGELGPNEVVRKFDGFRYFGLKATALDAAIKAGLIPKPIRLTPGGRAVGWLGLKSEMDLDPFLDVDPVAKSSRLTSPNSAIDRGCPSSVRWRGWRDETSTGPPIGDGVSTERRRQKSAPLSFCGRSQSDSLSRGFGLGPGRKSSRITSKPHRMTPLATPGQHRRAQTTERYDG